MTHFSYFATKMWCVQLVLTFLVAGCHARTTNIINGTDVNFPGKYPWQISLQKHNYHVCGGSVISDQLIVTAGHCVSGTKASDLTVVTGLHDKAGHYGKPVRYTICRIYQHELYNIGVGTFAQDIAIIKLDKKIQMNTFVQKIELDRDGTYDGNSSCVLSGWGYTLEADWEGGSGHTEASVLQETPTRIISNDECKGYMGEDAIYPGVVCVRTGTAGACMGDSGGPLQCRNSETEAYKLVGATSWGSRSCEINGPSMYTRIAYFIDWVDRTMADESQCDSGEDGDGDDYGDYEDACVDRFDDCESDSCGGVMAKFCCKTCQGGGDGGGGTEAGAVCKDKANNCDQLKGLCFLTDVKEKLCKCTCKRGR